ncbi:hypothetical protein ABZ613_10440 [Streptomyces collinus]|uniref:hypothetical protein n=1 Tax=Streptomyces TaxID=1883 RepID=UPI0033EEC315
MAEPLLFCPREAVRTAGAMALAVRRPVITCPCVTRWEIRRLSAVRRRPSEGGRPAATVSVEDS